MIKRKISNLMISLNILRREALKISRIMTEFRKGPSFTALKSNLEERLPKLLPFQMELLVINYNNMRSQSKRDELSKFLMQTIYADPSLGDLLTTEYCHNLFDGEELYSHVLAAICFTRGDIESTIYTLKDLLKKNPTVFNYLCLAHSFVALGNDLEAVNILKEGLRKYPDNFDLIMALGQTYFSLGDIAAANVCIDQVRDNPYFVADFRNTEKQANEIQLAVNDKITYRGSERDIYNDAFVKNLWLEYWRDFNTYRGCVQAESYTNSLIQDRVGRFLRSESSSIEKVIDFGVMCGYPDYHLAKTFPNIQFVCIDRQEIIEKLNKSYFNLPNLSFITGDILDVLPKVVNNGSNTVLFHSRTACLCYPEFLRKLYKKCFQQNVNYIALLEAHGLCKHDRKFYDFQDFPAESIGFRNNMFNHNYPNILAGCRYNILISERIIGVIGLDRVDRGDGLIWLIAQRK